MNEYEASKWNVIGQKVGKPAKVGQLSPSPLPFCSTDNFRHASSMQGSNMLVRMLRTTSAHVPKEGLV